MKRFPLSPSVSDEITGIERQRASYRHQIAMAGSRGWTPSEFQVVAASVCDDESPEGWLAAAAAAQEILVLASRTGESPAVLDVEMASYDLFLRAWHRDPVRRLSKENQRHAEVYVKAGSSISEILESAWAAGVSFGASDTGIYEVQGEEGIWKHYRSRRMTQADVGTDRIVFLSWDEMEKMEAAGLEPFSEVTDPDPATRRPRASR